MEKEPLKAAADLLLIFVLPLHIMEYRDHKEWNLGSGKKFIIDLNLSRGPVI